MPPENQEPDSEALAEWSSKIHSLMNCLAVGRSGCLLIGDALDRSAHDEIRAVLEQMQPALKEAAEMTRGLTALYTEQIE